MSLFWYGVFYLGANQVTSAITFPYFCFLCSFFPREFCLKRQAYFQPISSQWYKYAMISWSLPLLLCEYFLKVVGDDNPPYLIVVHVGVQVFTIAIACHPLSSLTFTSRWKKNGGIIPPFPMKSQGIIENKTGMRYHDKVSRLGFQNSYSWFRWWNQSKQAN